MWSSKTSTRGSAAAGVASPSISKTSSSTLPCALPRQEVSIRPRWVSADVTVNQAASDVVLSDCSLGSATQNVLSLLETDLLSVVVNRLRRFASEELATTITSDYFGTIARSGQYGEMTYQVVLDGAASRGEALVVNLGTELTSLARVPGAANCAVQTFNASPPACLPPSNAIFADPISTFASAALSSNAVNQALYTAWKNGVFCVDTRQLGRPELTAMLRNLVEDNGEFFNYSGTTIDLQLGTQVPPRVAFGGNNAVSVTLTDLSVRLNVRSPNSRTDTVQLAADLDLNVRPGIDPTNNIITLEVHDVAVSRVNLLPGDQTLSTGELDPARLRRFLQDGLLPLLNERLQQTTVSPAIFAVPPYLLQVRNAQVDQQFLVLDFDLFEHLPGRDTLPPETTVTAPLPGVVTLGTIRLHVGGTDDLTPSAFLRFRWRINDGPWTIPTFGGVIDVPVLDENVAGLLRVEVAAVDLDDNVDPHPDVGSV